MRNTVDTVIRVFENLIITAHGLLRAFLVSLWWLGACVLAALRVCRVGTCVGERNYRYFALFVLSISVFSAFMAGTCFALLISHAKDLADKYESKHDNDDGSGSGNKSWSNEFLNSVIDNPFALGVGIFSGLVFLSVSSLALYHIHLLIVNQTTNENVCCSVCMCVDGWCVCEVFVVCVGQEYVCKYVKSL